LCWMSIFDGMLQRRRLRLVVGGLNIKILPLFGASLAVLLFAAMFAPALCPALWEVPEPLRKAKALAAGDPVAIISPLPDEVSNWTWWNLNASGSSESDGMISNITWSITVAGTT
jgi:hypothetical protein